MTADTVRAQAGAPPLRSRRGVLAARFRLAARRDPLGFAATVLALLLVLSALLAPLLPLPNPASLVAPSQQAPSLHHLFGTDQLGRDVLSRTVWGARHTLLTAVLSTALAAAVGTPLGILAGYMSGWGSGIVMRIMDVLLAFPGLLLALVVVTILGPGVSTVVFAVGISFVPVFARVGYGPTRSIRAQDYIAAARAIGCSPLRIIRRHVLPVLTSEIIVVVSSAIGWTTLLAATLDFLGFVSGRQRPIGGPTSRPACSTSARPGGSRLRRGSRSRSRSCWSTTWATFWPAWQIQTGSPSAGR